MYLNQPTLNQAVVNAIAFERLRKKLIDQRKFTETVQTYKQQLDFLPDKNTGRFWDEKFVEPDQKHPMEQWRTWRVIKSVDPQKSLLNLGVGRGYLERQLFAQYPELKYTGTDITTQTLKKLRSTYDKQFDFQQLENLSYADDSFDQVLLLEVLEHIKPNQTLTVLSEVHRVLKKKGRFIISVPVNENLEQMLPDNPNSHMRMYSESLIRFELKVIGFSTKKVYRAAAFHRLFWFKHFLNSILWLRQPNNIILICQKP